MADDEREKLLEEGNVQTNDHIEDEPNGFFSGCIICCFGARNMYELTQAEREVVWHLRRHIVNNPVPGNEELQKMCLAIWNLTFPQELAESFETGEHWKRLGFQGRNPATDVRTGYWPLEQFNSLAQHHTQDFREMVVAASTQSSEYLFAISCFNTSHMLSMFFDLYTSPTAPVLPNVTRANKSQLKHLARLILRECGANGVDLSLDISKRVLNELNFEVVRFVHGKWMEMVASQANVTLMNYPEALRQGFNANAKFWDYPCDNLGDLRIG